MHSEAHIPAKANATARITGGIKVSAKMGAEGVPTYDGEYLAIPQPYAQVFPTRNKRMTADFEVERILLHEADNEYGTTVTIGG